MERAYYVEPVGYQFVVMCAAPDEAPTVVGGPFWTAIAAWKDAQHQAAESGASSICYTTAPDYVPQNGQPIRGAWVVRQQVTRPRDSLPNDEGRALREALTHRLSPLRRGRMHSRHEPGVPS